MKILRADYVLPIGSEPIREGAVAIDRDVIAAIGTDDELRTLFPEAKVEDLGQQTI